MRDVFQKIYDENGWKGDESVSGQGSTLQQTKTIRDRLPILFKQFHIKSVLDIPCGDFYWQSVLAQSVEQYMGADIVPAMLKENSEKYPDHFFAELDITTDDLPRVDLILCRDLLGHFSNSDVRRAINQIKASGSTYLLATTFPERETNGDIVTGQWRPINLAHFFGLPRPKLLINENCTQGDSRFNDKSLGLWDLRELRV